MRPPRVPFALDYISETVDAFSISLRANVETCEVSWANDVLNEYFKAHKHIDAISAVRKRYDDVHINGKTLGTSIPFAYGARHKQHVTIDALTDLATQRHSIRWFQNLPVPRGTIEKAIEVAIKAPTACNRQPFTFRIFDDPKLVQSVLSVPYGAHGYAHNVPVVVVIVGQQRHFFSERDRHLIYVDASLAAMGFLLALEAQGLSSCCIHWPDLSDREAMMSKTIHLELDERPIMLIAVGYADPDSKVPFSQKKLLSQVCRYNFE